MTPTTSYRLGLALAAGTALFLVLVSGAVGILGSGGRPDRVYVVVLAVLVLGTVLARLRAPGMALALLATAATQVVVTSTALVGGLHPAGASVPDILGITAMFAVLFATAAWLFRRADGPVTADRPRTPAPRG